MRLQAAVALSCAAVCCASACGSNTTTGRTSASSTKAATTTSASSDSVSNAASSPLSPLPGRPTGSASPRTGQPSSPTAANIPSGGTKEAEQALTAMNMAQRVGQLIMVDCPSTQVAYATLTAIRSHYVGSVILDGTSELGVSRTQAITAQLQDAAPARTGLFIATDQEGGEVQRMTGPGFSTIPSAVEQGRRSPASLRADAERWGTQLRAAGINVDLAPVLDTVPAGSTDNPPIGELDREYGHTPAAVTSAGVAVARGLADAGIDATVKHFPGLGRVTGNTDTTAGVTDDQTTGTDPYLAPFAAAIKANVPFVMMSTADYARLDPHTPAAFSSTIVTGLLRNKLGFSGVIISDDLGASAQVSSYSPGQRAVNFVRAGGDIVLTVDASLVPPMTSALIARAASDPGFAKQVDAAALSVLAAKQALGLLD